MNFFLLLCDHPVTLVLAASTSVSVKQSKECGAQSPVII